MLSYYLVGKVPVKMELVEGGGVRLVAYNPLLGGFVVDPAYYSAVIFGDLGRVREIDEDEYKCQVDTLRAASREAATR